MITFLPYPNFFDSAACLDRARLGKQRIEAYQILKDLMVVRSARPVQSEGRCMACSMEGCGRRVCTCSCHEGPEKWDHANTFAQRTAWAMWKGHEFSLAHYGLICCIEWRARGYKDTTGQKFNVYMASLLEENAQVFPPVWVGRADIHSNHRARLLDKDPTWYGKFGWTEEPVKMYVWP